MSLFSWKDKLTKGINSLKGNKDVLEAVCASTALVAAADGEISDGEIKTTIQVITSNPTLTAAYKQADIADHQEAPAD